MISYIKGELAEVLGDTVVLEAGSIGYNIRIPLSLFDSLPVRGSVVKLYTYLQVKEDGMSLFGFPSRADLDIFKLLLGVNGVGPKAALGILSALAPDDLRMAVISDDAKAIAKAPGVGAKTAQRIILDLKDKMKLEDMLFIQEDAFTAVSDTSGAGYLVREAVAGLVALGYSGTEAARAVKKVEIQEGMQVEDVLKASLKKLAFL